MNSIATDLDGQVIGADSLLCFIINGILRIGLLTETELTITYTTNPYNNALLLFGNL